MDERWSDGEMLAGLLGRDCRALEALVTRHARELAYFIRTVLDGVGTAQDVEECVNDTFIIAWEDYSSFDPARGTLRTWLTMRAKYIALDRRRHLTRRNPSGALMTSHLADQYASQEMYGSDDLGREAESMSQRMGDSLDTLLEQRERREEVRRALERLPNLDRLLVYLRYFQLASIDEIAQRTGLSKHAVDTWLWRVRKSLRVVLQEQVHDAPLKTTKRL